jgi:hypothetical protein
MTRGFGLVLRAVALSAAVVAAAGGIAPAAQPARTPTLTSPGNPLAPAGATATRYEVRLRKLHLVRPDLIPYPINYEVYC